jgi:nicotinamide mononucleotide transporter
VNTSLYVYLSFRYHLPGEATVNFYYTVMSLYGWIMWAKRNEKQEKVLHIQFSSRRLLKIQLIYFLLLFAGAWLAIASLKTYFWEGAIPWADALATAAAFTGMWLMTRKKVESWHWWILTNAVSIPLYYVKGLEKTAGYYLILLVFAFFGLASWRKKAGLKLKV